MRGNALPRLLIVEDDPGLQAQLRWAYDGYAVTVAGTREQALTALRTEVPAIVTLDLGLPPDPDGTREGFATLDAILAAKPDTKVVVASGHGDHRSALEAIERGAYDFYRKPVDINELGLIVARAFTLHRMETENRRIASANAAGAFLMGTMLSDAPEMRHVACIVERAARGGLPILIEGAPGTGKNLLARTIHDTVTRGQVPFVSVDCAGDPGKVAYDLFGDERSEGAVAESIGGTLFLDAVDNLNLSAQARLRAVLATLGDRRSDDGTALPVCVVSATERDLSALAQAGSFRADLYHRLAGLVVRLPPLSRRPGDAILLARHVLHDTAAQANPKVQGFDQDALAAIDGWDWPGNVRELRNRVRRAVLVADQRLVTARDLDLAEDVCAPLNLREGRERADRQMIRQALGRSQGNISLTARLLGVSRPTLYDLLRQYDMQPS